MGVLIKMTLELILWLITGFVISEAIFIFGVKMEFEMAEDSWVVWKLFSFLGGMAFMSIQLMVVFGVNDSNLLWNLSNPHYIWLFYELLILTSIAIFFCVNKIIVELIKNKKEVRGR